MNDPSMKVLFRVDSSITIGIGHVMRCLTLADELHHQGAVIEFICRERKGHCGDLIQARGYGLTLLSRRDEINSTADEKRRDIHWLSVHWKQDCDETIASIGKHQPDWLIVDHYGIDNQWLDELKPHVGKVMAIDDLADRTLTCDILFDQTYNRQQMDYQPLVPANCRMLLGTSYALLRSQFSRFRPKALKRRREFSGIRRIILSMGGMDQKNMIIEVLRGLDLVSWKEFPEVDIVISSRATNIESIAKSGLDHRLKVNILTDVDNMAEMMTRADIGIGAGGSSAWERCCLGLPSIVIKTAENQAEIINQLEKDGAILSCYDSHSFSPEDFAVSFKSLTGDSYQRTVDNAASVCDGLGAERTAKILLEN